MTDERFFNYYVEILNSTLHEALGKNIVFQTQAKISSEDIEKLKTNITNLENKLENFNTLEKDIEFKSTKLIEKEHEIELITQERDHAKNEASHIDTFRNELLSARNEVSNKNIEINNLNLANRALEDKISNMNSIEKELKSTKNKLISYESEIESLKEEITYLKMTPSQRKKYDMKKLQNNEESIKKDGGSF